MAVAHNCAERRYLSLSSFSRHQRLMPFQAARAVDWRLLSERPEPVKATSPRRPMSRSPKPEAPHRIRRRRAYRRVTPRGEIITALVGTIVKQHRAGCGDRARPGATPSDQVRDEVEADHRQMTPTFIPGYVRHSPCRIPRPPSCWRKQLAQARCRVRFDIEEHQTTIRSRVPRSLLGGSQTFPPIIVVASILGTAEPMIPAHSRSPAMESMKAARRWQFGPARFIRRDRCTFRPPQRE